MERATKWPVAVRAAVLMALPALVIACAPQAGAPAQTNADMAAAMAPQPESVARVYLIKVKQGMDAKWVEGAKAHIAWHRKMNDTWAWTAFYVETGENTGMYGWISQGHKWADLDEYDKLITPGDGENAALTMGPYEESYTSGLSVGLPNFSNPAPAGTQFPLVSVEHFTVLPGKANQFMAAISRAHDALQKGGFKGNYAWSRQVSGNEGTVFNLVLPLGSWADMADDPEFVRIMTEQLGETGMTDLFRSFDDALVTSRPWIARILPELSYTPGS